MSTRLPPGVATARSANMTLLGAAAPFIGIDAARIEDAIAKVFASKSAAVVDMNIKAFRAGMEHTASLLKGEG